MKRLVIALALLAAACRPPIRTMTLEIRNEGGCPYDVTFAASPNSKPIFLDASAPTNVSLRGHSFSFVVNNKTNSGTVVVKVFLDGVEACSAKGSDMVAGWLKPAMGQKTVSIHGD